MVTRVGNFGFVNNPSGGLFSFNLNAQATDLVTASRMLAGGSVAAIDYRSVNGVKTIPYGPDDDTPGYVRHILSRFYAGEGILGKKVGLQWGEGPQLYRSAAGDGAFYRAWAVDGNIMSALNAFDFRREMHRCLVDLVHLEGFWVKITLARGKRVGLPPKIAKIEHVPAARVRFVYPGEGKDPTEAVVGDFPNPTLTDFKKYPLFDPESPFKSNVSLYYSQAYTFGREYYSYPRFVGAYEWIELAGTLAGILSAYNENASAISMHIESPQSYWDAQEKRIREVCQRMNEPYKAEYLEKFKDEAMEMFAANMSGRKNAGKFMHTSSFWNHEAANFEGWKITPIDKKIKDYIDAQVAICKKAEAAATSGFGLDPALSNLILDTKLGSGSEKLYSLKVYNATETAIPDMVLCAPFQFFIEANFPDSDLRIGLYRGIVEAEQNVNPEKRLKANA